MKRQIIFITLISFFITTSCNRKKENTVELKLPIVYNIEVYRNLKNKKVTIIDTLYKRNKKSKTRYSKW